MSLAKGVAAVATAFALAPTSALAADLGAPLQGVTEALPVVVPDVSVPVPTAAPTPALPVAPADAEPAVDTARAIVATVAPPAETAPNLQDSPQLDAAPASRAPVRAAVPQPSTRRAARVAVAKPRPARAPESTPAPAVDRPVVETRAGAAGPVADAPLPIPRIPTLPSAAGNGSTGAGANGVAFIALLVAILLFAVPELGARAPLAPLLRRRFHVFSLLERPG